MASTAAANIRVLYATNRIRLPGKDVLVFVHGYSNTFTSAVQGAARLQVDIPFKEGPVVAFSWASWGKGEKYIEDGVIQGWSIEPFLKLLGLLKGAAKIHILAHSMGNRIALQALATLVSSSAPVTLPFGQLIFAAADEDSDVFTRIMTHLVRANLGEGRTLYASCQDGALWASARLHHDDRAGQVWPKVLLGGDSLPYQSRRPYVLVNGLDTIDCTGA
ncbi:DUF900-domain-containing protein [Coccomyxa subellipsoidea C-169]|uniref:DUF900-domain-containing protein n=1 Tax=Coccomyxa subellipsoidea (strain C-169) TaxID=574566 RepID=I0Z843_COCSC|nr:DUF900-domain-containing protein [Coccomyxa subellipsoidea C-169]EIE26812.1 DUF900-domain-containing protein [Coccomyxa subellipsoidea C-169]|eukprot:XP_005651356.1 DUF900-domain-containing protein [Coccomyxa subellipsoidea C-169]